MPELIDDGVSGFLVEPGNIERAVAAVGRLGELDRKAARSHVERHFSAERMVDDYLRLYQRILGRELGMHAPREGLAPTADPIQTRRPRPSGARCDACHARRPHVQLSRDGLLTICRGCARGVDLATIDAGEAIAAVASRAPAAERRSLTRRLLARRTMHAARRERRSSFEGHE